MLVALRAPSTPPRSCVAAVERIPRHRDEARAHAASARDPGRRRRRRRCHDGPLIATTPEDPPSLPCLRPSLPDRHRPRRTPCCSSSHRRTWRSRRALTEASAANARHPGRQARAAVVARHKRRAEVTPSRPRGATALWRQRAMQEVVPAEQRCDVLEHICGDRAALTARGAPRRRRECVTICHCHRGGGCIGGKGVGGWRRLEEELRWRLMSPDHRRRHAEARLVAQRAKRRRQRRGARAPRPSVGVAHPDRVRWRSSSRGCVPPPQDRGEATE